MIWRETPAFLHFLYFIPEDTWIAMDVGTGADSSETNPGGASQQSS